MGKTTTVQILSTLIPADGGAVQVAGHDLARRPDDVRGAIGVTGQYSAVDKLLTGEENLLLMADLKHLSRRDGKRRATELLARFDLVDAARKPAATPTSTTSSPASCSWRRPPPRPGPPSWSPPT
ncbi:ABC-type multidrug transport system ATPase subunit [Streptosporangium brasiliense]|uniref:ABC-type multidrug transport system ATPase subunit n=1 Tax=Streptosporangium brasiliense TaxID=47480 RepID=A0ABT9R3X8_9ACTN|nr:ABC-type multidrug transport system ATPase subunit [Streptosporangium brasiliense]